MIWSAQTCLRFKTATYRRVHLAAPRYERIPYLEELEKHRHALIRNDRDLQIIRYEIDIDPDSQRVTQIVLSLRSSTGQIRCFRFVNPVVPGGLENGPIYIVDIRFKGWETMKVEVCSDAEDRPTLFFAESIEEIA